jgi:arginyl-tRNA--protein-N-Asp/Glu arginylyltransferase
MLQEMSAAPFDQKMLSTGRGTYERRVLLHFDNALVHDTEGVQENLANFGFRRMKHLLYRPDLAPCDFLFSVQ